MMPLSLKRMKRINTKTKFAVFGFLRESEQKLSLLIIPTMIYYLCLAYYYQGEYFERCTNGMEISTDKLTVTHEYNRAFGRIYDVRTICHQWVDSIKEQVVKWKLKINQKGKLMLIQIRSNDNVEQRFPVPSYGFYNFCNTITYDRSSKKLNFGIEFDTGDIVTVALNTKERTIGVIKNGDKICIIWKNIKIDQTIQYKLCVDTKCTEQDTFSSVSLLDYSVEILS